jgi:hypothetical protein
LILGSLRLFANRALADRLLALNGSPIRALWDTFQQPLTDLKFTNAASYPLPQPTKKFLVEMLFAAKHANSIPRPWGRFSLLISAAPLIVDDADQREA